MSDLAAPAPANAPAEVPLPRGFAYLRALFAVGAKNPLPALLDMLREGGDLVRIPAGPWHYLIAQHPDFVGRVLQENAHNYRKSFNYEALRLVVGDGLLTSEGDFWKRQRRLAQPAFHRPALQRLVEVMRRCTAEMLERWAALPAGNVLDVAQEFTRLTLRIAGLTLFSIEVEDEAAPFARAVEVALRYVADRTRTIVRLPSGLPTPANLRLRRALRDLDAVVFKIIDERRKQPTGGDRRSQHPEAAHDLLALLMSARGDDGEAMSDQHLRDEVLTFLAAGHETTATALMWTFYLLALHPAERRKLEDEARAGNADLQNLPFAKSVVDESMRLYPPAWFIERQANAPDVLGPFSVPKDGVVAICSYTLHRDPRFWDDPEGFDPERFSAARSAGRPRFAYLPFGAGPRTCIGAQFAQWEALIVLTAVAARFRLELVPGHPIELDPLVTLRSKHGMRMRLHALR